jgi:hypothetical protein
VEQELAEAGSPSQETYCPIGKTETTCSPLRTTCSALEPARHGEAETWSPARLREQVIAIEGPSAPASETGRSQKGSREAALRRRNASPRRTRIDRNAQGCRHFGALNRRRGHHFGDGLASGAHGSPPPSLRRRAGSRADPSAPPARPVASVTSCATVVEQAGPTRSGQAAGRGVPAAPCSPFRGDMVVAAPSGAGTPGRVNDTEPLAERCRRKVVRPVQLNATTSRSAEAYPTRRGGSEQRDRDNGEDASALSPLPAEGYPVVRRILWNGTEAQGSIGRLAGGNASRAQRTRRWSKALRSGTLAQSP